MSHGAKKSERKVRPNAPDAGVGAPREPLWSAHFVLALAVNFLIGSVFIALVTTIALYVIERFQASEALAGMTAGAFILGALFARLFLARFVDQFGRRRTILVGLAAYAVTALLYFVAGSIEVLIAVRLLHGAAFGFSHTGIATAAMAMVPTARRAEGTGYFGVAGALVMAAGPLVGVTLSTAFSLEAVFVFASVVSVAALVLSLFLRTPEAESFRSGVPLRWRIRLSDILEPSALGVGAVGMLSVTANSGVMVFLSAYALSLGEPQVAAVFFAVLACAMLVSRFFTGRLQDRWGSNAVMNPLLALVGIALVLIAVAPGAELLYVAAVLLGVGHGGTVVGVQAIAISAAAQDRLPVTISTVFIVIDAGAGLGPLLMGVLLAALGFSGMFLAGAGIMVLALLLYFLVHGRFARHRAL